MSPKTVLITGGAGFIGTALTRALVGTHKVVAFDTLRRNALAGSGLLDHPDVTLVKGDVRDYAALAEAVKAADAVVHMASIAGVDTVLRDPVLTMEVSIEGTMNVLRAARESGRIRRFIDFSTSEVFGRYAFRVGEGDVTQLGAVGEARWTYAVSKLATEHLSYNYFKQYGLPTCAIRPFNIYGPGQVGEGAVHHFVVRAIQNERITIHNEGDQIRAWCYIDDIVDAIRTCLERDAAVGHTFNIGNPRSTVTIYNLARLIIRLAGSSSEVEFVRHDQADVELRIPNIEKAARILGFRPRVDLEEGLTRTIKWYREHLGR
ncbi:MAG: NAD-dependent epimerase/dehydratase family protein [Deltaproteobacteria bacterium]|nr:NAD-dependent epimerase/dehydratase family protein [Deltaproteobacteria bacterium]